MEYETDEELIKARGFFKNSRHTDALKLYDSFIARNPDAWVGYREKADVLRAQKMYQLALETLEKLTGIGSEEPNDYYDLARLCVILGKYTDAIYWADIGISLCEKHENYYYYKASHFYKAYSLVKLSQYKEALEACLKLDDDYSAHIADVGMVTRKSIVSEAKFGIERQERSKKIWKFEK